MERPPLSMDWQNSFREMAILPKAIHRVNEILMKNTMPSFAKQKNRSQISYKSIIDSKRQK
jgi:hypothetical protein